MWAIHAKPEWLIWAQDPSGFVIEPLHRGFVFTTPMQINLVENGLARRLDYDAANFDLRRRHHERAAGQSRFLRLSHPAARPDRGALRELAIFQGASFFRSHAPGQNLGVNGARPVDPHRRPARRGIPAFPRRVDREDRLCAANALTIHALLDSESVTGAYRFTLHPGDATIIDTECSLFPRAAIDNFGTGDDERHQPVQPARPARRRRRPRGRRRDHRPANADRRAANGFGARSPTATPCKFPNSSTRTRKASASCSATAISTIFTTKPSIGSYVPRCGSSRSATGAPDRSNSSKSPPIRKPRRTSSPSGARRRRWPRASRPISPIASSGAGRRRRRRRWRPPGARGADAAPSGKQRRFLVDFRGDNLNDFLADPARAADVKANLTTSPGKVVASRVYPSPERKTFRVQFDIDPGGDAACEMRLALEAQGAPISETWLYRWTP